MLTMQSEPDSFHQLSEELGGRIDQFNMQVTGVTEWTPVVIALRDDTGRLRGGIVGFVWGTWFHLTTLVVDDDFRRQDWGNKLMAAAEDAARKAGARNAYLETYSFQARPFYERHGYAVFATLEDFPPGHTYFMMRKALV